MRTKRNTTTVGIAVMFFCISAAAFGSPLDRAVVALGTDVYVLNDSGGVVNSIVGGFSSITDVAVLANGNIAVSEDANGGTIYVYSPDLSTQVAVNSGYGTSIEMAALDDGGLAVLSGAPNNAFVYALTPTLGTDWSVFWGGGSHIGKAGNNEYIIVTSTDPVYRFPRTTSVGYIGVNFGLELRVTGLANGDFLIGESGPSSGGYLQRLTKDYVNVALATGVGTVSAMEEFSDGNLLIGTQEGYLCHLSPVLATISSQNTGGAITGLATFSDGGYLIGMGDGQVGINTGSWNWINMGSAVVAADSFVVPEPATISLLAICLFGAMAKRNKKVN